jgi:ribonuclease D
LLDDNLAMNLAQQPPTTLADLDQRCRGQRALRSAQRNDLFELVTQTVTAEDIAGTASIPAHPQGAAKQALGAMKQLVDARALELDLPPGLLCPRKVLEEYAVTTEWPEFLDGWRREVLHDRLVNLLPD